MNPLLPAAVDAYRAGKFAEAADRCRSGLASSFPDDEALLTLLGMAEHAAGDHEAAAATFERLVDTKPDVPEYWSNLGYMRRLAGRFEQSEHAFLKSLALAPHAYGALVNYGLLLMDMGRFGAARHRFLDAVEVDPEDPVARVYGSLTCFECGDAIRAGQLIPPSATWSSLDADQRRDLAMALVNVGRADEATDLLIPDAQAGDPFSIAQLALVHERTNKLDEAELLLDRIKAHLAAGDSGIRKQALALDAAIAMRRKDFIRARNATEQLLALPLPASVAANANFTLAKVADKLGDADEAMRQLEKAHVYQLALATEVSPAIAAAEEPLLISMERMRPEQCMFDDPSAPDADHSPVFIVGFPRSGTTMLEQMLDAHPRYVSMDEQLVLHHCIKRFEAMNLEYPYQLDALGDAQLEALREAYWTEAAQVIALPPGRQLVDKNPLNLLRLPMIKRLFPAARIILALRHPCDVLLSCYMQNFRSPAFMALCSSLERLAKSYSNTMQSWIHHQRLLQANVLELRYEDTVGDFPAQVERIAEFLGISDSAHLSGFAQHASRKGYISTPSYSQVVEPVTTASVARWHRYRSYFEPVFDVLDPVARHWGYRLEDGS